MDLEQVAPNLWRLALLRPDVVNVYLAGDVLIDSGGHFARRKLVAALEGRAVTAHALTHAHFDHQGSSHAVCERFGVPLWCGEGDREAVESGDLTRILPDAHSMLARLTRSLAGPAHPVSRTLVDGDQVGGFTVIETPGHTPGHLAFWRERDGALIVGDALFHRNPLTLRSGLTEAFGFATFDRARSRDSARKLAALKPGVVCFGHGAPLRDGARFCAYVSTLP